MGLEGLKPPQAQNDESRRAVSLALHHGSAVQRVRVCPIPPLPQKHSGLLSMAPSSFIKVTAAWHQNC